MYQNELVNNNQLRGNNNNCVKYSNDNDNDNN